MATEWRNAKEDGKGREWKTPDPKMNKDQGERVDKLRELGQQKNKDKKSNS